MFYKERRFRDNRFSDESPKKARALVKKREAMAVRDTRFEGESMHVFYQEKEV